MESNNINTCRRTLAPLRSTALCRRWEARGVPLPQARPPLAAGQTAQENARRNGKLLCLHKASVGTEGSDACSTQKRSPTVRDTEPRGQPPHSPSGAAPRPCASVRRVRREEPRPHRAAEQAQEVSVLAETSLVWESLELITNRLSNFGSLELIKLVSLAIL